MKQLSRAGWVLCALLFGTLLSSLLHVDHAGWLPDLLLAGFVVLACVTPHHALLGLLAAAPVALYFATQVLGLNSSLAWAEALACAALTGFAVDAARRGARTPAGIAVPALLFGALLLASLVAGLSVLALRFGPDFTPLIVSQLTREYFTDNRSFPALHAGVLLLEGTLLAAHGARLAAERSAAKRPIIVNAARALTVGAALAAACTLLQLLQEAWGRPSFFRALGELAGTARWNIHYADHNAAGSYYAMAVLVGAALVWRERGAARGVWAACVAVIALGLWVTSSRIGVLAVPAAVAAAFLLPQLSKGGAALARVAAIAVAACGVLVLIAVLLPQKGSQQGVVISTDVRIGLIQTGLRMIRSHPVFGLGLAEFYPRSAEYSSAELLAKFPAIAARGENAHNNFVQVAAELGIIGGIFFTWLVAAALIAAARQALRANDRFLLLVAAGVGAFALTMLGGHPLLIPEPGYLFWAMAGIAAGHGASKEGHAASGAGRVLLAVALLAIVATTPWRMRALESDANLEHVGINVSPLFQTAPDGTRYREAKGWATLFVPTGAFKVDIQVRSEGDARLEVRLDRRIANVVTVVPGTWFHLTMPARTERATSRFARLDLRLLDAGETVMWITKVQ
jgi:O-antigen ligase